MSIQLTEDQVQMARCLADPDKAKRVEAINSLESHLLNTTTELDMLKLWKALYYCMWLCDKQPVQMELAEVLSSLSTIFTSEPQRALYFQTFFRTVFREWPSLDQYRVEKYYAFVRVMLRHGFKFCLESAQFRDGFLAMLEIEILSKRPNGLRFHMSDIFVHELYHASQGSLSTIDFLAFTQPFFNIIQHTTEPSFHDRVAQSIFKKYLLTFAREINSSAEEEVTVFKRVNTQALQKLVFDIASDDKTNESNRRKVYALHKEFYAVTGVEFVDVVVADDVIEQTPSKNKKFSKSSSVKAAVAAVDTIVSAPVIVVDEPKKDSKKRKVVPTPATLDEVPATLSAPETPAPSSAKKVKKTKKTINESASSAMVIEDAPVTAVPEVVAVKSQAPVEEVSSIIPSSAKKQDKKAKASKDVTTPVTVTVVDTPATVTGAAAAVSAPAGPPAAFIASKKFAGAKPGYAFHNGKQGLGYYVDHPPAGKGTKNNNKKSNTPSKEAVDSENKSIRFGKTLSKGYADSVKDLAKSSAVDITPTKGVLKVKTPLKSPKKKA